MKLWKTYVKDTEGPLDQIAPYFVQWAVWCWRKPIYYGLPLIILSPLFLALDGMLALLWLAQSWGKKEE